MRFPLLLGLGAVAALALAIVLWPESDPVQPGGGDPRRTPVGTATEKPSGPDHRLPATAGGDEAPLAADIAVVRVLVRDENGKAIAGCRAVIGDSDEKQTGEDGKLEFGLAPGRQWLEVTPNDATREPLRQRVTAIGGRRTEVVAVLQPRLQPEFHCRIVAAETGKPIQDAAVAAIPLGEKESKTDDQGLTMVRVEGAECVRVGAPGRSPRRFVPRPGHATAATPFELPLDPAASLKLEVVDAGGKPVADAAITLSAMPWALMWPAKEAGRGEPELWSLRTGEDGRGELADLPARCALFVTVAPPEAVGVTTTLTFELAPGANDKRVQLQPLGEVRGRVLDPGDHPIAGARVIAIPAQGAETLDMIPDMQAEHSMLVGEDGSFHFGPMAPGAWLLGLQQTDGWSGKCVAVEIPAGGTAEAVVRAEPGLAISGTLLGPGSKPISAFEVHALRSGRIVGTAITEHDGSWRIPSLPAGDYDIFTELYQSELAMVEPVRAPAGRSGVTVRVANVLGTAKGKVERDPDDHGELWLRGLRREGSEFCGGQCDLDGLFEQPRLRSGTWDFVVSDRRGKVGVLHGVQIAAGRTTNNLEVVMKPGALLRPSHPTADMFRVQRGDEVVARDGLERGLPAEAWVPPGAWTVVFLRGGFEIARREVTIAVGEQQMVAAQ